MTRDNDHGLRERASSNLEEGAVIRAYLGDRERVLRRLNDALATELICVLRYKRHSEMASGIHAEIVGAEFLEHAQEEQGHADRIAKRITQLNGEPDYNPDSLSQRSHTEYRECSTLGEMIRENLIAERIAIEEYGKLIRDLGDNDSTTRRLIEEILENEEEHADELARMLAAHATNESSQAA